MAHLHGVSMERPALELYGDAWSSFESFVFFCLVGWLESQIYSTKVDQKQTQGPENTSRAKIGPKKFLRC